MIFLMNIILYDSGPGDSEKKSYNLMKSLPKETLNNTI